MADFNQFAASDEENTEIKKLTLEVVRNRDLEFLRLLALRFLLLASRFLTCPNTLYRKPTPITSSRGRSSFAPVRVKKAASIEILVPRLSPHFAMSTIGSSSSSLSSSATGRSMPILNSTFRALNPLRWYGISLVLALGHSSRLTHIRSMSAAAQA